MRTHIYLVVFQLVLVRVIVNVSINRAMKYLSSIKVMTKLGVKKSTHF